MARAKASAAEECCAKCEKDIAALKKEIAALKKALSSKSAGGADARVEKLIEYLKLRSSKERNKADKLAKILSSL